MKYSDAGVDIDKGNEAVKRIKSIVKSTFNENVLTELGSFGGLYELGKYKNPVLVSGTDGVGTKLKIAFLLDKHDTVGIDLVAMSVNDVLVQGAKPLFFLDYIATSKVEPEMIEEIVKGVVAGCKFSSCALLGGETAELPGFYADGEYDLAGFAVGVVEKDKVVTGADIKPGNVLIGLPSSGIHSNGYSLARKALIDEKNPDKELLEKMLVPTKIYVKEVLSVMDKVKINGMVHITGGGFYENIPRVLPDGTAVEIDNGSWPVLDIFKLIKEKGNVEEKEMFRTFNMGIGYILFVDEKDKELVLEILNNIESEAFVIGKVVESDKKEVVIL